MIDASLLFTSNIDIFSHWNMASKNETRSQLHRYIYEDDDLGTVAFQVGSSSSPRRPPAIPDLRLFDSAYPAPYVSADYTGYAVAGGRTSSVYADDDYYQSPADFVPAPGSGYTTSSATYRAPSTHASEASSFQPSIFSRARTSTAVSSRPPRRAHFNNFVQELAAMAITDYAPIDDVPPIVPAAASHPLWCELWYIGNCTATFRLDQTREWKDHHSVHLRDHYPEQLVCWFCDHIPFGATGRNNNERYGNFWDRMDHIREHISGEYRTRNEMRPDYSMINHLADHGIIDDGIRRRALECSELPKELRLPHSNASGGAQSYQPQGRLPGPGLAYDLTREQRHQRPRGGPRHRHH